MKTRHIIAGSLVLLALLTGVITTVHPGSAETTTNVIDAGACPSQMAVTKPFNGETVSGIVTFEATAPQIFNVKDVNFRIKDEHVFGAQKYTDPYWRASLDSRISELDGDREYQAFAVVFYSGATSYTYKCRTPEITINVRNNSTVSASPAKSLEVAASLQQWTGPTNVPFEVVMKTTLVSGTSRSDVTGQSSYEWSVTRGVLTPQGYRASVNSGPSSGDGTIRVKVSYSGMTKEVNIPMKVQSSTESSTYPTATTSGQTTTTTTTKPVAAADQPATVDEAEETGLFQTALSKNGQGDAELERCLSHTLGEKEYQERIKKQPRLGFREIARTEQCFARRKLVVPVNLAPIEPTKVKELPESDDVELKDFQTVTRNGKQALEITGTAKPNQMVIIYIFSEPLVLVTKADDDGKWTYILEDPMEPGEHEAYVTVEGETEDSAVRSGGFGFAIAAAPKSNLNPLGLSFAVQESDRPKLFYGVYIGGALLVVGTAIGWVVWRMRHHSKLAVGSGNLAIVGTGAAPKPGSGTPQMFGPASSRQDDGQPPAGA